MRYNCLMVCVDAAICFTSQTTFFLSYWDDFLSSSNDNNSSSWVVPSTYFYIIIPHVNSPYKTSIDERLIFYNIPRCYSDGEYCHSFAIAAGDIIKYQSFV